MPNVRDNILKYNAQVPRYTSYPTAPHFSTLDSAAHEARLTAIDTATPVSIYLHIPFCNEMCWYCGCHTTATRKYAPVEDYISLLIREIRLVQNFINKRAPVAHIHFGGGSPTMLQPADFLRIMDCLQQNFTIEATTEIAIEADPRGISADKAEAYRIGGVNRMSFGIQDFSPAVQAAINRVQPFSLVERAVCKIRDIGIERINFDLMYGLPCQTVTDVAETAEKSLSLKPDRLAVFGYAHVPWMKKHMRLIQDADLPDATARLDQFNTAEKILTGSGMAAIGIDHFVAPKDDMNEAYKNHTLARNFQGYTTDAAETLIGFGMSSIGRTRNAFFQNHPNITEYRAAILANRLPVYRGCDLSLDDLLRAHIISELMCYLEVDIEAALRLFSADITMFDQIIKDMSDLSADGLVTVSGRHISINPAARQIARVAAARFDAYFSETGKRHTQAA